MSDDWTDRLAGARMQVDKQYQDTLEASSFTSQEWGLVMTAVDWEIDDPENPEEATLVADTSKLPDIIPELEQIQSDMGGAQRPVADGPDTGGLLGRVRQYVRSLSSHTSGEPTEKRLADAKELVEGYTLELQQFLEERGQWADICQAAADQQDD